MNRYPTGLLHSGCMRATVMGFLFCGLAAGVPVLGCTGFKITRHGRTLIGGHEDSWSINARVRFVNGREGELGAVYFSHYNGSPLRRMNDQGGMNEAGLVFDGFAVPVSDLRPQRGKPIADIHALVDKAMRTCRDVHEAAALFTGRNWGMLNGGMLFFCDRTGDYLVVEADTLFSGDASTLALGNFRVSQCTDLDAVPIERYQRGRRMLATSPDTSLAWCTALLDSMHACRSKLGEGTLYSFLADPANGRIHLFFYHDFTHRITYDLAAELAKGDHELEMASLFPANAEFERLLGYKTPFHQRWLWWMLACVALISALAALWALWLLARTILTGSRTRSWHTLADGVLIGSGSAAALFTSVLLMIQEGVFYFGLGDAVDRISPVLRALPWFLLLITIASAWLRVRTGRHRLPWSVILLSHGLLIGWLGYWGTFAG